MKQIGKGKIIRARDAMCRIEEGNGGEPDTNGLEGYSGKKLIATLHALTDIFCGDDAAYLEIGVFRGLTLLSNAYAHPGIECYGIDNFSLFDEKGKNLSIITRHIERLKIGNTKIIDRDFDDALDVLPKHIGKKRIGVFFIDGPHDYRSQLVALLKIVPHLSEECAIVIDDSNYAHVRQANNDFLKTHPDFALLMEAYTKKHIANMNEKEKAGAIAGWWDGVNVLVRDSKKTIPRKFAHEESRKLYFTSHDVFRHEYAEIAPELLKLTQRLSKSGRDGDAEILREMKRLIAGHRKKYPGRFPHQNTYSEKLPKFLLHSQ